MVMLLDLEKKEINFWGAFKCLLHFMAVYPLVLVFLLLRFEFNVTQMMAAEQRPVCLKRSGIHLFGALNCFNYSMAPLSFE